MSSLPLGYSTFEPFNNNNNKDSVQPSRSSNRNKTQKNRSTNNLVGSSSRVEKMMEAIHGNSQEGEEGLGDFNPPPHAKSSGLERLDARENKKNPDDDSPVTTEGFDEMAGNQWSQEYYQQHIPMYTTATQSNTDSGELIEKINYMIHLLEEERDVKTGNVTEEVVLYCFLGVFVIFVVDSFAKVGKYVR